MRSLHIAWLVLAACSSPNAATPPDGTTAPPDVGPFDHEVAAADVSILYPITSTTIRDELIAPNEAGAYGTLLPEGILTGTATVPYPLDTNAGDTYADVRLVSLRLDPCGARGHCAAEVRAVFQPVLLSGGTHAGDGAIHVFYTVPSDELLDLLEHVLALKKAYGAGIVYGDRLGPQPILAATGLSGDFARGLHTALLSHLGEQRIGRVTFMRHVFIDEDAWQFVQFDRTSESFVVHPVVNGSGNEQEIIGTSAINGALGGISGVDSDSPTLPKIATLASSQRPAQVTPDLQAGFAQAIEAQHPMLHNSEDTDCGSCHLAEGARRAGTEVYALTPIGEFTSTRSLAYVRDTEAITNFHAFGYFGVSVSVMQRTANESAVVADRLQAALAP